MLSNSLDNRKQEHEEKTNADETRSDLRDDEPTSFVKWLLFRHAACLLRRLRAPRLLPVHTVRRQSFHERAEASRISGTEICSIT